MISETLRNTPQVSILSSLRALLYREWQGLRRQPIYVFCMVVAPLFCLFFFTSLMQEGVPKDLPVGVVDQDRSAVSRNILRNLNSFSQTEIKKSYPDVYSARKAMQRGELYGFYYIPSGMERDAIGGRRPTVSFYTNYSYLIAGSFIYRDMRTMSELAGAAVVRQTLYARGATDRQAMALLQPIVVEPHAIHNPWLNYAVYLCNTLVPGILGLLITMMTVYAIGCEIKDGTARQWLSMARRSMPLALLGKLLPHTLIYFIVGASINLYLYGVLHFPCHGGLAGMMVNTFLFILACQGLGILMIAILPALRLALSFASLWGVVAFSISGFSFPVMAMHPMLQGLSWLFPLRHFFLIYVNHALNGYAPSYAWPNYAALLGFVLLPFLLLPRLKKELIYMRYIQ